ncbi:MAG: sensor histidine kinase [Phototrophicaceae bacterium]
MMISYRLLLVDDDEDEFLLTKAVVKDMAGFGHVLDWVDNFEDGLAIILKNEHDAYILDYHLGAKNGVELIQLARTQGSRAPMIILTGFDTGGIDELALEAGASDYLEKWMLSPHLLARSLRYAIRQQEQHNQLEDLVQQVQQLEQAKTDMLRVAAHDLRTPLTVLHGYAELLREDLYTQMSEQHRFFLDELTNGFMRMQKMVSDILSLERIERQRAQGYTDKVNLVETVQSAYGLYHGKSGHDLSLTTAPVAVWVYGDPTELGEAISNLIANAIKYTPEASGHIQVSLMHEGENAVFRVKDNGYGVPHNMQAKLFEPFYRAKTAETRKIAGTGLGLHLVKRIIERHKGTILFESVHQHGSTFGFQIPLVKDRGRG